MPQGGPAARENLVAKIGVYDLRATGAKRGTPVVVKPLTTTKSNEVARLACIITAALYHKKTSPAQILYYLIEYSPHAGIIHRKARPRSLLPGFLYGI